MGAFLSLIDIVLFLFFVVMAVVAPLIDAQYCLATTHFPELLIDLRKWYIREYDDYLMSQKPLFFLGIVWLKLLFQWPLALINLFALSARKSWFTTPCLIYGVSCFSSMVAILGELTGSGKASDKLLMVYYSFTGLGILAILRGLVPHSVKSTTIGKRLMVGRKKEGLRLQVR